MSAQHTQDGPWIDAGLTRPNPVITGGPLRLIKSNGVVVAFLPLWLDDEGEAAEAAANARLIAAAPELLDALDALVSMCDAIGDFSNGVTDPTGTIDEGNVRASELIRVGRAAISKATGEQA